MARNNRTAKQYGAQTQRWVAAWYQQIWPAATTQGAGVPGRDVLNIPLSVEVKGRADFSPLAFVRQARKNARPAEDLLPPHAVIRPIGLGESSVGEFLVIRSLADDTALLAELLARREEARTGRAPDAAEEAD